MFPSLNIKTKNFTVTPALRALLEKRLAPLGRLLPQRKEVVCDVELGRITKHHQAGKIFRVEINLDTGTLLVRAEALEETMESAIDQVKQELKAELQKMGSRKKTLERKGARVAKDLMRKAKAR